MSRSFLLVALAPALAAAAFLSHAPSRPQPTRRAAVQMADVGSTLIIQNKGGGHGEIGYHLALQLANDRKQQVTILHEGPNSGKAPHNAYGDLDAAGVKVIWCDDLKDSASCIASLGGASFDAVVDNWSKSPEDIMPYAELAKSWDVSNFAFVSSAGMYTPPKGDYSAIKEDCDVKSSGQRKAEVALADLGLPYSYFRPQYIYGPKQGKSYLSFFFDRLTRGKPVPVPGTGEQSVTFTHAADNAAMIAAAIGNEKARGAAFNCATSSLLSYNELVGLCAKAAGVEPKLQYYSPGAKADGFKFPFRDTPFFVSVDKAKDLLGFEPSHEIAKDIEWYFADNYVAKGSKDKQVDLSADDAILAA